MFRWYILVMHALSFPSQTKHFSIFVCGLPMTINKITIVFSDVWCNVTAESGLLFSCCAHGFGKEVKLDQIKNKPLS